MKNQILCLFEREGTRFYSLLFRLTLRHEIADDLMQDLFLKLQSSEAFLAAKNPQAYARRIAINLAMDWQRAKHNQTQIRVGDEREFPQELPLDGLVKAEMLISILESLAFLTEVVREVVVRRYLERESYEVIGESLGKTAHQVRALCYMGIRQLRERLISKDEVCNDRDN